MKTHMFKISLTKADNKRARSHPRLSRGTVESTIVRSKVRKKLKRTMYCYSGTVSQKSITPRGKYPKTLVVKVRVRPRKR